MRKILFASVLALVFMSCNEQEKKITTDIVTEPTSMKFEEEAYEFGTISQGEKVYHSFKFTNTGNADLVISSAKGSCGCTVPTYPKEPIAPGESGVIEVVFDSNGKKGSQHKKVFITANTDPSSNVIAIKGEVLAPETEGEQPAASDSH